MKIYLISGKARSGKDEVANLIKEYYEDSNKKIIITNFSKYLKYYAQEILNWNLNDKIKPRTFLQDIGEELRSNFNQDIFVRRMIEDIYVYKKYFDVIIISDVRLPQEIAVMKDYYKENIVNIHVVNNNKNDLTKDQKNHITETALEDYKGFDYLIINDKKEDLVNKVNNIMKEVEHK